jgi:hypothetical protein
MTHSAVSLTLDEPQRVFQSGETLSGQYRLEGLARGDVRSVELSVLWYTEGKGDEDLAIHYFERWSPRTAPQIDPGQPRRFATVLPNSPLSYDGVLMKIRWCVRLRVQVRGTRDLVAEAPFRLGLVPVRQAVSA